MIFKLLVLLVIVSMIFSPFVYSVSNSFYQECAFANNETQTSYVVNFSSSDSLNGYFYNSDEAKCLTPPPAFVWVIK